VIDSPPNHINYRKFPTKNVFFFLSFFPVIKKAFVDDWIDVFKPFQDGISIEGFLPSSSFAAVQDVHAYTHFIYLRAHTLMSSAYIAFI